MVAPSRLTFGLERALEELGESREASILGDLSNAAIFSTLQIWFQQLDYSWSKWVLGFDNTAQTNMLKELLGSLTPQKMRVVFLSAIGLIGLILALYFLPKTHRNTLSPSHRVLLNAIKCVEAKTGKERGNKTLSAFMSEVNPLINEDAAKALTLLCEQFEHEKYAHRTQEAKVYPTMKRQLKMLKQALK